MPESFSTPPKVEARGLRTPFKDPIGEAAGQLGFDPKTPAGRKEILKSMGSLPKGTPKVPPTKSPRTTAEVKNALKGLSKHALSPKEAKAAEGKIKSDALKVVGKAVEEGRLKGGALKVAKSVLRNSTRRSFISAPSLIESAGTKALGITKGLISGSLKFLGYIALPLTIASFMFDAAEASSGAPKSEMIWEKLKEAYENNNTPFKERLKNLDEFLKLSPEKRKVLLEKYNI